MKKALKWLAEHSVDVEFHDYKKQGVPRDVLPLWSEQIGWENLINKRGTTWRKLDDEDKEDLTESKALRLLTENPSLIKRPVLSLDNEQFLLGFSPESYAKFFT